MQLAAHLSQYHAPCRAVARRFSKMTSHVADLLEAELDGRRVGAAPSEESAILLRQAKKAKQTRWRAMALACHGMGALDDSGEDAASMIRLMVRAGTLAASSQRALPPPTATMGDN